MMEEQTWESFVDAKLFWWVNRSLHIFGWALVREVDENGKITRVYPAHCRFRGFSQDVEERGFEGLTKHIAENTQRLLDDLKA